MAHKISLDLYQQAGPLNGEARLMRPTCQKQERQPQVPFPRYWALRA